MEGMSQRQVSVTRRHSDLKRARFGLSNVTRNFKNKLIKVAGQHLPQEGSACVCVGGVLSASLA